MDTTPTEWGVCQLLKAKAELEEARDDAQTAYELLAEATELLDQIAAMLGTTEDDCLLCDLQAAL